MRRNTKYLSSKQRGGRVVSLLPLIIVGLLLPALVRSQPLAKGQSKFLGNILGTNLRANFETYWNQVTAENAGKWGNAEGSQGNYNWAPLDNIYNYALNKAFKYKHHTLVWGNQQPGWITSLDSAGQRAAVKKWIDTVASRYGSASFVDVVNEPLHAVPSYAPALGGSGATGWDWVVTSFQWARLAFFPGVKLILNEYSVIHDNTVTTNFLKIIDTLRGRGLIDGIGIQGHGFEFKGSGYAHSPATLTNNLNRLAATGLPIYISEFDISEPVDATQLQDYQTYFSVVWDHPGVKGVTLWGYVQGDIWRTDGYLVRFDESERPALQWLRIYVATPAPVAPIANSTGPRNPLMVWKRSAPASSYRIQVSVDSVFASTLVNSVVSDTSFRVDPLPANSDFFWRVAAGNTNGTSAFSAPIAFNTNDQIVTGVQGESGIPSAFALLPNYPNPFNPTTKIRFALPRSTTVRLTIHNLLGSTVRTLVHADLAAGEHAAEWDATDDRGGIVASGVYFYRLESGEVILQRKMMLVR